MKRKFRFAGFFFIAAILIFFACDQAGDHSIHSVRNETPFDDCPPEGDAKPSSVRELNLLKNRTAFPEAEDFDSTIDIEKILQPGDDRSRWNDDKAIELTGYVADVKIGGVETCNCKAKDADHRDTHIELVLDPMNFVDNQKMIVEVTPRVRRIMSEKNEEWSTSRLRDKILGRWVKVKGWLLFDKEHESQAENTNPGNPKNWRATCWEIHPVTFIEVVNRPH